MSTNSFSDEIRGDKPPGRLPDGFGSTGNPPLDECSLASLAGQYFPEFAAAQNGADSQKPMEEPAYKPLSSRRSPMFGGSRGIDPRLAGYLNLPEAPPAVNDAQPYAFLERAGSIFTPLADASASGRSPAAEIDPLQIPERRLPFGGFDAAAVRRDFPILSEKVHGKKLIWLDNAATTQKPRQVVERLTSYYEHENSNVHRSAHALAARSTDAYDAARSRVADFLNASSSKEIIFVRGTTEAINLVAQSWGKANLQPGDEIVVTLLEHHANIVPWQLICTETGAKLRVIPVDESGQILLSEYIRLLGPRTKLVAAAHVSNALGTVVPVGDVVEIAHRVGAKVLIDGAQAVSHLPADMQSLDCDFYVFSGHKVFGPTGVGALYAKSEILEAMPPYQGGGNMISDVTFEQTVYQSPPARFEAGTGNIADAVGLGAALDYVGSLGMNNISRYERRLLTYGTEALLSVPGLRLIGTARDKTSILSFVLEGFTNEDVGKALSQEGIAVRAGHHCAQPILRRFGLESTVRPSLAFYNTFEELDILASVLRKLKTGRVVYSV
jgi:cysteine desulfurase/selenocysteine lyase